MKLIKILKMTIMKVILTNMMTQNPCLAAIIKLRKNLIILINIITQCLKLLLQMKIPNYVSLHLLTINF